MITRFAVLPDERRLLLGIDKANLFEAGYVYEAINIVIRKLGEYNLPKTHNYSCEGSDANAQIQYALHLITKEELKNKEKYEKIIERLNELKGQLLLDTEGLVYSLKGYLYVIESVKIGTWPFKKLVTTSYISQIELNTKIVDFYEHDEFNAMLNRVNHIIYDRRRYLKMYSNLAKLGYMITMKKK